MTVIADFDIDEQRPSRRLWVIAGIIALSLHLGGAAVALIHLAANHDDDGLGANTDEFAVEMVSPKVLDDNLPQGPDSDATQASQQQIDQKANPDKTDLPLDKPTDQDDADRAVSLTKSEQPKDDAKPAAVQTEAAPEQQQAEATSRQALDPDAPNADVAKAPNPHGLGKDKLKLTAEWGKKISATFKLHQRYPEGHNGPSTVKVAIVLNRRGNVLSASVLQSSGDAAFDDAAISMIHRSDPVPLPPAGLTDDQFNFSLDVSFPRRK